MRYIIASDIHGSAYWCERLLHVFDDMWTDRLILLGDVLYHGPRNDLPYEYAPKKVIEMLNKYADKIICVRGNCDTEVDQMVLNFPILSESAFICDFGQRLFASHGHKFSPQNLPPLSDGDVFIYGHTHVPEDEIVTVGDKEIRCLNPGSVSIPKNGSVNQCLRWKDGIFSTILL